MRSGKAFAVALAVAGLCACGGDAPEPAAQGDWRAGIKEIRMAVRGSEEDPTVAERWDAFRAVITRATGLPVRTFESSDYNGTIQALSSGQVDLATGGANSYANVYAQVGELVAPVLTARQAEGGMGYWSALMVRTDSPYRAIEDLKGKSIGYVDFNSTSGYLWPRQAMRTQGIDPDTFFGRSGFAGGHTQNVMALANGQFDAIIVNVGGGDPENGFSNGAHYTMARRGLIDLEDYRIIWAAGPMPNSPLMIRADRPQAMRDAIVGALASLPYDEPDTWIAIGQVAGGTYAAVDHAFYTEVVRLRDAEIAVRRGGGEGQ